MLPGRVDEVGVQQVAEQLDPVDQARAGPGEGRGGVDGEDAAGAERLDRSQLAMAWARGLLGVPAAGHRDDDVGIEARRAPPSRPPAT